MNIGTFQIEDLNMVSNVGIVLYDFENDDDKRIGPARESARVPASVTSERC